MALKLSQTSFCPSLSKSTKVRDLTLSPVTVQNGSLPCQSNPWIEQFPPTKANGTPMDPKCPTVIAFTPSGTCNMKKEIEKLKKYANGNIATNTIFWNVLFTPKEMFKLKK